MSMGDGVITHGDEKIYYTTPFGDTRDGYQRLFLLERDGIRYVPAFRTVEAMKDFFSRADRAAYMILEGDVQELININRSSQQMRDVGIVIDPLSEHPVAIEP